MTATDFGPPPADYDLDAAGVTRVIARQFPELAALPVTFIGEGYDSRAFRVGDVIVRFPKRAEVLTWSHKEQALLPLIASRFAITVPRFGWFGEPDDDVMYAFAGYRAVPGTPCDFLDGTEARDPITAGRQLGQFLRALHAVPLDEAEACGVERGRAADPRQPAARARVALSLIASYATPSEFARWDEAFAAHAVGGAGTVDAIAHDRSRDCAPCLIHADLLPEHILIEPTTGQLSGVIDWADASIGDPAGDLVAAFMQPSLLDTDAALDAWSGGEAIDPATLARARLFACCVSVIESQGPHTADDARRRAELAIDVLRRLW